MRSSEVHLNPYHPGVPPSKPHTSLQNTTNRLNIISPTPATPRTFEGFSTLIKKNQHPHSASPSTLPIAHSFHWPAPPFWPRAHSVPTIMASWSVMGGQHTHKLLHILQHFPPLFKTDFPTGAHIQKDDKVSVWPTFSLNHFFCIFKVEKSKHLSTS